MPRSVSLSCCAGLGVVDLYGGWPVVAGAGGLAGFLDAVVVVAGSPDGARPCCSPQRWNVDRRLFGVGIPPVDELSVSVDTPRIPVIVSSVLKWLNHVDDFSCGVFGPTSTAVVQQLWYDDVLECA